MPLRVGASIIETPQRDLLLLNLTVCGAQVNPIPAPPPGGSERKGTNIIAGPY